MLVLASCSPKKAMDEKKSSATTTTSAPPPPTTQSGTGDPALETGVGDPTTIAVVPTTAGARNFDQINSSMESVTGIVGNRNVISRFNNLKAQLPSDNDIKSFSFNAQSAITVLAAEYCNALIVNTNGMYATQLAAAIGNFNLTNPPTTAFAGTAPATLAQMLIVKFWGSSYATNANAMAAQAAVVKLIADLPTGQTNNATTTRNTVIGACTSVLASAPMSVY